MATSSASTIVGSEPSSLEAGTLETVRFTSHFVDELPGDSEILPGQRRVSGAAYSMVLPTAAELQDMTPAWLKAKEDGFVRAGPPKTLRALAAWSESSARLLGITRLTDDRQLEIDVLSGNGTLVDGMQPYAACYGGHQFGQWAGQLGDGRAIVLGEANGWDVQLKGAGKTPYSRTADGRAVLRSSVREFLASEFMHALGVPTTRALALVTTGTGVIRDMFYVGEPRCEPGAVVTRLAPTFLRLGNFQYAMAQGDLDLLRALCDYAIKWHFPHVASGDYVKFAREVSRLNAIMVARWMAVGFVHGVMNTDNFSILGLTLDYGPYGFLDEYDPDYTPNTTDFAGKRYVYRKQPEVARWNILQFVQSIVPLTSVEAMQEIVDEFHNIYEDEYNRLFAAKLGISALNGEDDLKLLNELLDLMSKHKCDFTNTWRLLMEIGANDDAHVIVHETMEKRLFVGKSEVDYPKWILWVEKYKSRLTVDQNDGFPEGRRLLAMSEVNPVYVLRNYMAQIAIEKAENNDFRELTRLFRLLSRPYEVQDGMERYTQEPPDWAHKRGVKVNSCSS